ncbi:protein FAR1-RELATED SEQUENCE 5-like isoform X2 [Triticum urartu]|uniref:protein FAR1-RELATED SEQUENCE 5-like isoform X2 n=1 Tax=Triticum urartu TaxID=4572 RepID=UPI002044C3AA|nr:protein FAR1-RELATED SEQUENCE 5-like isoform X2 [Triticum urartu]
MLPIGSHCRRSFAGSGCGQQVGCADPERAQVGVRRRPDASPTLSAQSTDGVNPEAHGWTKRPEQMYGGGNQQSLSGQCALVVQMACAEEGKGAFGPLYMKEREFQAEFYKVVNHMLNEDEFETTWGMLLNKYNLKKHPYMTQIYEIRRKWPKTYFKEFFCIKMTCKERSKSVNCMLKKHMPPARPMHTFVRQYMRLLFDREREESYEDKRMMIVTPLRFFA